MTPKQRLIKIHFYSIIFVTANFIMTLWFDIGIHRNIIFICKIVIYLTGLTLFFLNLRPFKKISIYFSIYLLSPILIGIAWLADGIFGAILGSVFFAILYLPDSKLKDDTYIIYENFQGFLGSCCTYDIIENKSDITIKGRRI